MIAAAAALYLLVPCLLLAALVGLPSLRRWRELRAWARTGTSLEEFLERYPARKESAEALELARLAEPLGLRLVGEPSGEATVAQQRLLDATEDYLKGLVNSSGASPLEPVPEETRELLLAHHAAIAAVVEHLASATDISWEMDISANLSQPQPRVSALFPLNRLLLVVALECQQRRDCPCVRRALEAAWRERESLDMRPDLASQFLAMGLARQENAVLRMVSATCVVEPPVLPPSRYRSALPRALQGEAFSFLMWADDPERGALASDEPSSGLADWFSRAGAAGASAYLRRAWGRVQAEDPCNLSASEMEQELGGGIPRWEFVARIVLEGQGRAWSAALGSDLDAERTSLVLAAHERRRAGGDWAGTGAVPSEVCQQIVWRHESDSSGSLTIAPESVPPSQEGRGWAFTLLAPARSSPETRRWLQ